MAVRSSPPREPRWPAGGHRFDACRPGAAAVRDRHQRHRRLKRMNPRGWLTRLLGDQGERIAARHLKQLGYRILARQTRSKLGEIDLIALDGATIVFVEVK